MPLLKNAYFHQLINPNLSPNMNNFEWTQLLNPEFYITLSIGGVQIGLYVVLFIVFAETGLFAGFFLPGDSLLFLSGIYSRSLVENLFVVESDFINVTF